jgi:anti-sigma regulatory factor (Ser/Thr protein kinase)
MRNTSARSPAERAGVFRHEAFLYSGEDEYLQGTLPFIREGVANDERVLVVVDADKIELLRANLNLNGDGERVLFADMEDVGRNPARIIPAWRDFVGEREDPSKPVRGIGEPIHPGRTAKELVECHRHESLLNVAFADTAAFTLMCPYDTDALDGAVIEAALRNHPYIRHGDDASESRAYGGLEQIPGAFDEPLPDPPAERQELSFQLDSLTALRDFVRGFAADSRVGPGKADDLLLAMSEVAANSIAHGGGRGLLRIWEDGDHIVCEILDRGWIDKPLAGRERPLEGKVGGRGLWLANQLCELVQLRSFSTGSVVRLHVSRA